MLTRGVCRARLGFFAIALAEVTTPLAMRPDPSSFSLAKRMMVSPWVMRLPPYIVFCAANANSSAQGVANLGFDREHHAPRLLPQDLEGESTSASPHYSGRQRQIMADQMLPASSPATTIKWPAGHFMVKTHCSLCLRILVAKGGIEPPTQGFSVLCSTN
jgi:hypothetical protein